MNRLAAVLFACLLCLSLALPGQAAPPDAAAPPDIKKGVKLALLSTRGLLSGADQLVYGSPAVEDVKGPWVKLKFVSTREGDDNFPTFSVWVNFNRVEYYRVK